MSTKPFVSLCGASGTGKTTLAREIGKALGVRVYDEVARELLTPGVGKRSLWGKHRGGEAFQNRVRVLFNAQLTNCRLRGGVTCRSMIDAAVFSWQYEELFQKCLLDYGFQTPDVLLYVPICPEIPLVADGIRNASPDAQACEDLLLREILERWGIEYRQITATGLEERLAEALKFIGDACGE